MRTSADRAGTHYIRLAALAVSEGYAAVTRWVVQSWVKHGLLPKVGYQRTNFGPPQIVVPPRVEGQLLALCRLRYERAIRSHRLLAAALWAEGWVVATNVAREGLHALLAIVAQLANPAARDGAAWVAAQPRNRPSHWAAAQTERLFGALEELMARISGAKRGLGGGLEESAYLEEVTGLSRARTDRIAGTEPWLDTAPGAALAEGAEEVSTTRLLAVLDQASDEDLEAARATATELHQRLAVLVPALQLAYGANAAGFGSVPGSVWRDPLMRVLPILIVLAEPEAAQDLLNGLPQDEQLVAITDAADLGRSMIEAHPALKDRVDRVGLVSALAADDIGEP